ncbi:MAG: hypothetical protein SPE59_08910 [Treponema sp.]|nr:hypothetical protein [Treponema sp.]
MSFLNSFLYYTIFSSVVLIYGIGLNRIAEFGISKTNGLIVFLKEIIGILLTSILSWLIISEILIPLKILEVFPVISFLIFISVNSLLETLVLLTSKHVKSEFIVSFLIVLLSLSESTSLLNTILICASCFVSIALIVPFCITFKNNILSNGFSINEKYYSLFFVFLGILILMMSVWDIIWLNPGVIK